MSRDPLAPQPGGREIICIETQASHSPRHSGSRRRFNLAVLTSVVAWGLACLPAVAQTIDDPSRTEESVAGRSSGLLHDVKDFVTAPGRWRRQEWLLFAGVFGAVGTAYHYDGRIRSHFASNPDPSAAHADWENSQDIAPAAVILGGTWLAATLSRNEDHHGEAATMLRAAIFSAASAEVLKAAFGREAPGPGALPNSWRNGSGRSFPSGHAAFASAIGAVLAESGSDRHRWLRRTLGYGLAVGTAYARVTHDSHWLSDSVAGTALGIATARFFMNRRDGSHLPDQKSTGAWQCRCPRLEFVARCSRAKFQNWSHHRQGVARMQRRRMRLVNCLDLQR